MLITLGLEVASLEKKVSAMSLPTLGLGTCCLKGEASEEQAIGWCGMHDILDISQKDAQLLRLFLASLIPCSQVYQGLKIGYRFIDTVTLAY